MTRDYVADHLDAPSLDHLFPNMIEVDKSVSTWPWLRRDVDHPFRVDRRNPIVGFINRDEASLLYSNARLFVGRGGLEIGAWRGWSTAHLIAAGLARLHVVEPLLEDPDWRSEFADGDAQRGRGRKHDPRAGEESRGGLAPGRSPACDGRSPSSTATMTVRRRRRTRLPARPISKQPPWSSSTTRFAARGEADLRALAAKGWNVMAYQTAQMMGVAWRGEIARSRTNPTRCSNGEVPGHLAGIAISGDMAT